MAFVPVRPGWASRLGQKVLVVVAVALASCSSGGSTAGIRKPTTQTREHTSTTAPERSTTTVPSRTGNREAGGLGTPLPVPTALPPLNALAAPGEGGWHPAGRLVGGVPAVYETTLVPPGSSQPAGIAWMDTHLLSALLYSGSKRPGGGPYLYTAPIEPAQAVSLVAAFNGGFLMDTAGGGYLTEGRVVVPLVTGAASLVIYANGTVSVGVWGSDVSMTSDVVSVRQNLMPLVEGGQPTAQAAGPDRRHRRRCACVRDRAIARTPPARPAPRTRRCRARHGARHQPVLDLPSHLRPDRPGRGCRSRQRHPTARRHHARAGDVLRPGLGAGLRHHVRANDARWLNSDVFAIRPRSDEMVAAVAWA